MAQRKRRKAPSAKLTKRVRRAVDALEGPVKDLRKLQSETLDAVVELVRGVNHDVVGLAKEVLRRPPLRKARARKPAKKAQRLPRKTTRAA